MFCSYTDFVPDPQQPSPVPAAAAAAAAVEEKLPESAMEELKGILVGFLHDDQSPDFDYEASYWSTDYRKVSTFCLFTKNC